MSRHPEVKWAQREDRIFITVLLADTKDPKVNLEPEGVFKFSATAGGENHSYELKLDLLDKVNVEESKINISPRSIFCILEKAESKWWDKLLKGDAKTPHYVKVDWDKWVDEDDDPAPMDAGMDGMDFSKFGGMGGMPGMEALAGMGGMGGMGGMPGMPGMGGMPDMGDFSMGDDYESDEEVEEGTKPEMPDAEKVAELEGKEEAASST
ncbi:uncharacterized protein OsI_027940-like [Apium graveolens]|uniref:uncharacterized protein OsI_027940-like n=1 Tax=Apium graveolens TaxID=4045 RepID=UPI003D7B4E97